MSGDAPPVPAADTPPAPAPVLHSLTARGVPGALARYRLLAYLVGTGLLVLVVVGIPLQFGAHQLIVVKIIGPIHGYLYLLYLALGYDLTRRSRLRFVQLVAVVLAGLVPGLAFVVERWVTRTVLGRADAPGAPGDAGPPG